ncbi:dimethylmenaquinone methyltransferase [Maritimibacter sp. 55A14]|uniref:TraR/DksA family transcriptional regulator n=1 Tax=Maritimibacter sp. 55A14 TaxID=2174844 RepID=UPI000D61B262|nr:TraR/DksA family transcriptional regulator [Maritimibacter sp. 55A14]PWE31999.1 dimethylmenaquinone methyltransferase [Maritimibacter sp. 55A14]
MIPVSERKAQLEARKAELETSLDRIENTLDETPNADAEERATEREGDEVLEGLGAVELRELTMIRAALKRIEAGEYGYCTKCGEQVSEERLDLLPYTPFCRKCAT